MGGYLELLGEPLLDGERISECLHGDRKAQALLCYLASEPRGHSREHLVHLLWPEVDEGHYRLLSALLSKTRGLGRDRLPDGALPTHADPISWQGPDSDVVRFRTLLKTFSATASATVPTKDLSDALGLLRGEFLMGVELRDAPRFTAWLSMQRRAIQELAERALLTAHDRKLPDAQALIEQAVTWWPGSLRLHRVLIEMATEADQPELAKRRYLDAFDALQMAGATEDSATLAAWFKEGNRSPSVHGTDSTDDLRGTPVQSERQLIVRFLTSRIEELSAEILLGTRSLTLGDLLGEDRFFLTPSWRHEDGRDGTGDLLEQATQLLEEGRRALILGDAGQGKTTLLKLLFIDLARRFLRGESSSVPFYVALSDAPLPFRGTSTAEEWLAAYIRNMGLLSSEQAVITLAYQPKVALLLDGFDETIGSLDKTSANRRAASSVLLKPNILTSRRSFYDLYLSGTPVETQYPLKASLQQLELEETVLPYIHQFCRYREEANAEAIVEQITGDKSLCDLATRPLTLNMMLDVFVDPPGKLPHEWTRERLYDLYTQKWLSIEAGKPDSRLTADEKDELIEQIAWGVYQAQPPSTYAYGDPRYQELSIPLDRLRDLIIPLQRQFSSLTLNELVQEAGHRTLLLTGSGRRRFHFVHKSFFDYYVAKYVLHGLITDNEGDRRSRHGGRRRVPRRHRRSSLVASREVLGNLIPVEIASFLKEMLASVELFTYQRNQIVDNLIAVFEGAAGDSMRQVMTRQNVAHYLANMNVEGGNRFLETAVLAASEEHPLVTRSATVSLALFRRDKSAIERYVESIAKDDYAASVNRGYHLVYYGDQALVDGYQDVGGAGYEGTLRAILRHLHDAHYNALWPLDIFTLDQLVTLRGPDSLVIDDADVQFLARFVEGQRSGGPECVRQAAENLQQNIRPRQRNFEVS